MSRISRELGITAWYADNKIVLDSGGNQYRTNHTLQNAGRYIILITYGKTINGVTIINKTTNKVVQTIKPNYNLTNINEGMKEVDYEVQLGADLNMTNNMSYQTTDGFKIYNFYISNEGTTEDEYIEILNNLGYTNAIDYSALK